MKNKLTSALLVLGVFYGLPLSTQPQLLLHPCILCLMLATTIIWFTQPAITPEDASENQHSDRYSVWVILLLSAVSVVAPIVEWAYFERHSAGENLHGVQFAGLGLLALGITVRLWAIRTLGRFFTSTVQVQDGQRVITAGPYAFIRHPSYLGAYLAFLGSAVLLEAWTGLLIAAMGMGLAYRYRIAVEEVALQARFGVDYQKYMQKTYKMLPLVW